MSTINPGTTRGSGDQNAGTAGNAYEVRAVDPQERGKEASQVDDSNAAATMQAFAQRCIDLGGTH